MSQPFTILIMFVLFSACSGSNTEKKNQALQNVYQPYEPVDSVSMLQQQGIDSVQGNHAEDADDLQNTSVGKSTKSQNPQLRNSENFTDENFNGKPITHQIELPKKSLEKYPDTLNNIAVEYYRTYENLFPRSISDKLESGSSHEKIIYPEKILFRFQIFENEFALKPYSTKDVTVQRSKNGTLTAY